MILLVWFRQKTISVAIGHQDLINGPFWGTVGLKSYTLLLAHSYSYSPWTTSPKEKDVGFLNTLKPRLSGFYGSR